MRWSGRMEPGVSFRSRLLLSLGLLSVGGVWTGNGWPGEVRSPCAIHYPSDDAIAWQCRRLQKGETLETLFGARWPDVARFNRVDRRHVSAGREIKVPVNLDDVASFAPLPRQFPAGAQEHKLILIDLSEQYLGAYEQGRLRLALPIASGEQGNDTPTGAYRITAADRTHVSCLYTIERTGVPYPMHYGLRFHVTKEGVSYWIHGRDMPGYPASHGCVGLYDEDMQREYYGIPRDPQLRDARTLYEWVLGDTVDTGTLLELPNGPRVVIQGITPGRSTKTSD